MREYICCMRLCILCENGDMLRGLLSVAEEKLSFLGRTTGVLSVVFTSHLTLSR
jgi:hypothetical protein